MIAIIIKYFLSLQSQVNHLNIIIFIMGRNQNRFVWLKSEGFLKETRIIIDTETGVNYLFVQEGYAGGLTPLLDANGKPIVTR